jgi:hypothetical protein
MWVESEEDGRRESQGQEGAGVGGGKRVRQEGAGVRGRKLQESVPGPLDSSTSAPICFLALLGGLQGGEYARLQAIFYDIPELQDDENTFREIEDLFLLYAASPDEELDEACFTRVLVAAGEGAHLEG